MQTENKMDEEGYGALKADVKHIKESVLKIERVVIGDNGEGLMQKVKGLATQIKAQWFVIVLTIGGLAWIYKILLTIPSK